MPFNIDVLKGINLNDFEDVADEQDAAAGILMRTDNGHEDDDDDKDSIELA